MKWFEKLKLMRVITIIRCADSCTSLGMTHCILSKNMSCFVSSKSLSDIKVQRIKYSLLRARDSISNGTN